MHVFDCTERLRQRGARAAESGPRAVLLLTAALISASLIGCGPQEAPPPGIEPGEYHEQQFSFVRSKMGWVRVDSSSGEAWTVALNGDGGWTARGGAPDLAGEPARNGRFLVRHVQPSRNTVRVGEAPPDPVLIRLDRATGRAWLLDSEEATSWTLLRESGAPPVAPAEPAAATPEPASAPSRPMSRSKVLQEDSPDEYPILKGDQLGVTPEEKKKTVETLRTARTKTELPLKMRRWAVRQLGQVDPDLAVPELLTVLQDAEPILVVEAVEQLASIGRASTIPQILKLQDHPDASVRDAVAKAVVEVE